MSISYDEKANMRVAIYHNLPSGGAKRALYEWIKRLSASHVIDVYSLTSADHAFCDVREHVNQYFQFSFRSRKLFSSPLGRLNRIQKLRDFRELDILGNQIAQQMDKERYDIVFVNPCVHTYIPSFLAYTTMPSLYYLHEPFGPSFIRHFRRPYFKLDRGWRRILDRFDPLIFAYERRLQMMRKKSIHNTNLFLANSHFTRSEFIRTYGVDATICHYGVNTEEFHPINGFEDDNSVITVGELTPRKGHDFLIESLSLIPASERPCLKIAYNWENPLETQYLQELAYRRGVHLRLLSNLNTSQLAVEYNKSKLCVYAPVMEPFGLVPLEAMACGTPVVAVAEGGVSESVSDGFVGRLTPRDPVIFAEVLRSILANEDLCKQYGEQAQAYVRNKWTWDESTIQIEKHLRRVASVDW